ncbi:hypothetical protein BDW22DRAFT_1359397 [Trametopsis cervina]|nr:hypothetical protein BDW22DRAFT_1359397 [Trametopsis cervina]
MSYYCDPCDRWFPHYRALQQHRETSSRHTGFFCQECDKEFATEQGLKEHYIQSPRHPYCPFCEEHFDDRDEVAEHHSQYHYPCLSCRKLFKSELGLHEHNRQSHWYCGPCRRVFQSENNLNIHLRTSAIHNPKNYICPGRNCSRAFISYADLALHFESGTCPSGMTRKHLKDFAIRRDKHNIITNPDRLIGYREPEVVDTWANERAWNGYAYECPICPRTFGTLPALNTHLRSPAHEKKIFRCPTIFDGCGNQYKTLSGLLQHMERSDCGVKRYRPQITGVMDDITQGMKRITF